VKLGGSGVFKNWRKRWFVLKNPYLYYFKSAESTQAIDRLYLRGCSVSDSKEFSKPNLFSLALSNWPRIYYFSVETPQEKEAWMKAIHEASL